MPEKLGRYEIVRELGRGAMGVVYEGRDPKIGRRVAIKTARRDVMASSGLADEMMARFLREASAAGALNHPNIITIYDADEEDGMAYIAMEFLEGGDLTRLIRDRRGLSIDEIAEIGATICEALAAAHDQGIIHRDVKPANILMPKGGILKVADFGIAHVSDSTLTQDGALIGTPHYMSPEQFMGQRLDGRSDLFSVAIILYELLTGEKPFTGESLSTVMHHVIKTDPVPPCDLNLSVPDPLNFVILKALNKRPPQRYADGRKMAAALRETVKDHPDPEVLGMCEAPESPTIVRGKPETATVIQAAPTEATVQKTAPAETATIVSKAPPEAGATLPGKTPFPETAETLRPEAPAKTKRSIPAEMIAGIVLILALIAIGIGIMRGGSAGDTGSAPEASNAQPGPVSTTEPPLSPENAPQPIEVEVYYASDLKVLDAIEKARKDRDKNPDASGDILYEKCSELEPTGDLVLLPSAKITVFDSASKKVLKTVETDFTGQAQIALSEAPESLIFEVAGAVEGQTVTSEKEIRGRDHWERYQAFVLYQPKN